MKSLNLKESIDFLNNKCGYIDVENDEDYTDKEIIKIANEKYKDERTKNKTRSYE